MKRQTPVGIVRSHPLLSFVLLACLFGWYRHIIAIATGASGSENFPLGPIIATLIVVSCQGREELRSWGRLLKGWRAAPRWYLLALLVPAALQMLIVLANHGLGAPLPSAGQLADWPEVPVAFVTMLIFVGIGEEAGWTAFAAPILLRRHSLLVAWALASAMRIFWHLPMMINGELDWVLGTVGNAGFTMVTLLLVLASDGRWTLVAVWHAALNATGGMFFFPMVTGADHDRLGYLLAGVYALAASAAYVIWMRDHPSSAGAAPSGPAVTSAAPRRATTGGSHAD